MSVLMGMSNSAPFRAREPRLPLMVQVLTDPPLLECWTVDISRSGLGLAAVGAADYPCPAEGAAIQAELCLPDSGALLRLRGTVAWHHEIGSSRGGRALSLGVAVGSVDERGRRALEHYLEHYRFRVVLAFAGPGERRLVEEAVGKEAEVLEAASLPEVERLVGRGDVAVLLLAGDDAGLVYEALESSERLPGARANGTAGIHGDLRPRVICCADVPPLLLLRSFNIGALFRTVERPLTADALHAAVLAGCQDFGVRTEQHRLGLALERTLWRERARGPASGRPLRLGTESLVHASEGMGQVLRLVGTVAPFRTSVLLTGETGAGKDIVARLIHELSGRATADFIVQDCGTLTETLLESELFGNTKGAFTGAVSDRDGLFVAADGGTVLLDEVENTSPGLQAKLLRVIETGEVRPVGGTDTRVVDVRIIAASNRDLQAEVAGGRFRADLYYRLSMFPIHIPALRDRRADILPLARRFLRDACTAFDFPPMVLSAETAELLEAYDWPGNARELRNVIERALLLRGPGAAAIEPRVLPPVVSELRAARAARRTKTQGSLRELVNAFEAELIRDALEASGGAVKEAALTLLAPETTLWRKAKRYRLK